MVSVPAPRKLRVGIVADYAEEGWPSMDLVAERLVTELATTADAAIDAELLRPAMRRRFSRPGVTAGRAFNADRLLARFVDYPRWLRRRRESFDLFHLVDHSYSQLVHSLPSTTTIVSCYDLDTFRCLLDPAAEPRGPLFRAMVRHQLAGFRGAARIACSSRATRDAILAAELAPDERVTVVPLGLHPAFLEQPDEAAERRIDELAGPTDPERVDLLHVGSTIPRKRIGDLLRIVAAVGARRAGRASGVRLLRAGGLLSPEQRRLAERLGAGEVVEMPFLDPAELAALYRRAALVLLPSEREGFGLPVIEALACGTPMVASDLDVLREAGGEATTYAPLGDVDAWARTIDRLLTERDDDPPAWRERRAAGRRRGRLFSWSRYARRMTEIYRAVRSEEHHV